ncbi:hypothetical protein BLOT_013029 [Blomia tropicalis]|nr:hypothetical protein BLOT_013029 [Blomia tropicalis]
MKIASTISTSSGLSGISTPLDSRSVNTNNPAMKATNPINVMENVRLVSWVRSLTYGAMIDAIRAIIELEPRPIVRTTVGNNSVV